MGIRARDSRLASVLLVVNLAAATCVAQTYEVVHAFVVSGGHPAGSMVAAATGVLYGTTQDGGDFARGSVFSLTPDGSGGFTFLTLHSFTGPDGATPRAALGLGTDGYLYGTTSAGGAAGAGTVFRMTPSGQLTRLHDFADGGGRFPSDILLAFDGSVYGTASAGGDHDAGTIFRVEPDGTFSTVHSFDASVEGAVPVAGLLETSGYFYGTTSAGGTAGQGTAFRLDVAGAVITLHNFSGPDGSEPSAALILGLDQQLYGTTRRGGAADSGTVFRMDAAGAVTTLHSFNGTDGSEPMMPVIQASDGKFYGTTQSGGGGGGKDYFPAGTAFRIDNSGSFEHLYSFAAGLLGTLGYSPASGLTDGHDGYLYGTTLGPLGSVYRINTAGSLSYVYFVPGDQRPQRPLGPLTEASGVLYGTTANNNGTIFRLDGSEVTVLHQFAGTDGSSPYGGLLFASDGGLYGATFSGGTNFGGTTFRLNSLGVFELLHSFGSSVNPEAGLVESPDGDFYGTTVFGGDQLVGTVYHMDTSGAVTTLHAFSGADGFNPESALIHATDGNFYGTTTFGGVNGQGNIYSMTALGAVTGFHDFTGTDGASPAGGLLQAVDGDFYGATAGGGANGLGTIYRIDASGTVTTLHAFTGLDGSAPRATLVQASDGKLYGTANYGGSSIGGECGVDGCGTVFRVDTLGNFELLHDFVGADGKNPISALLQASDGALYGTTPEGGFGGGFTGVVFRLLLDSATPSPTGIGPSSGRAAGGTPVAISGDHLYSAATVAIGGVVVTPPAVPDQGTIYTVSPALAPGTLNDVSVSMTSARSGPTAETLAAAWFADFSDVSQSDIFHPYVEAIFRDGITAGCSGGNYCRNASVTRAQMAVFLLKAEHGSAYVPPACSGVFPDVTCPSPFADWIEQLATEGVTAGCGAGNYCPGDPVTRRQMAVFLLKTKEGSSYAPPPAVGIFDDVPPSDSFAPWIEELSNRQITGGCQASPPLYCPASPNTRGQMAVFLVKTFGL